MTTIYTTGDGKQKQYAKRDDGVWFVRFISRHRGAGNCWGPWMTASSQAQPLGLYSLFIKARLPK